MGENGNGNRGNSALIVARASAAQLHACEMVAAFEKPADILEECRTLAGGEKLTRRWVYNLSSPAERPRKWAGLIDSLRAEIPVLDIAYRMQRRQEIVEVGIKTGELKQAREALNDVERLVGDIVPTHRSPTNAFQFNFNNDLNDLRKAAGDMNRPPANEAEMKAWHALMLAEMREANSGNNDDPNRPRVDDEKHRAWKKEMMAELERKHPGGNGGEQETNDGDDIVGADNEEGGA